MSNVKTLTVNFIAGPGTGKSTVTAHTFALLKWRGVNCEMAMEFAKDKVWERSPHVLHNQDYVYAKQYKRLKQLQGQVDVVLTDGPLLHSIFYSQGDDTLNALVLKRMDEFNNLNIFLKRVKPYNPAGRTQTFEEAKEIDRSLKGLLDRLDLPYVEFEATPDNVPVIVDTIVRELGKLEGR